MSTIFPYVPRKGQTEIVDTLQRNFTENHHTIIQSGTGTGKTICMLSAAIATCDDNDRKILYLTRTNSQQKQVIHELRAISDKKPIYGLAIQGRRHMCPYMDLDEELRSGTYEEHARLCSLKKNKVLNGDPAACKFYHTLITADCTGIIEWAKKVLPTAEEFVSHCSDRGLCPYELNKLLISSAKVVTAPYIYFFNPFIRNSLLEWMGCTKDDLVLIVDEAHNLPEYARELKTAYISKNTLKIANREAVELRDPEISEGTSSLDFLKMIEDILTEAVDEFLIDEDGLVPSGLLEEELMSRLRVTTKGLLKIASELVNSGEIIRDRRKKEGRLPRSYLYSVGAFLEFWLSVREEEYVKLVVGGDNPRFEAYCLDSSLACNSIMEVCASVHMSGTLEPLEEYRDSIGLPKDSPTLSFPSPFPKDHLMILYVNDVTSKYEDFAKDKKNLSRMKAYIQNTVNEIDRNTAVFFPSHNLLKVFLDEGLVDKGLSKPAFFEEKGMPQDDLMDIVSDFKNCQDGALLMAVSGGRISEGIDFPERELEIAIIAGIPYPKPSARTRALQHYYEVKFGKGWEYVVKAPTTRKMLQSIGRLIRSESDRGVAIILDKRAIHFSGHIPAAVTIDPVADIKRFFDRLSTTRLQLPRRNVRRLKTSKIELARNISRH